VILEIDSSLSVLVARDADISLSTEKY